MTIPLPVLDDRSFEQILAEAKARIPVHTPEWTNTNESDPGIAVLELFAFLTDNLLYRSNRIPEANRLKFLSMLGISLRPASPGVGLVAFQNDRGPLQSLPLPAGIEVRAGKVPFRTQTPVDVLPISAAPFYKRPRADLDASTQAQYRLLYATFLNRDTDVLSFYDPVALDPPQTGKPGPVVDLGDATTGTIDHSLWIGLLGPKGADLSAVRAAIANNTLTLGVYPAAQVAGRTLAPSPPPPATVADPGLVVEIAAPAPGPPGQGGIGPANYRRLPVVYANNVLQAPGIIQVTLPDYGQILLWDLDPEEEGTGDFPPGSTTSRWRAGSPRGCASAMCPPPRPQRSHPVARPPRFSRRPRPPLSRRPGSPGWESTPPPSSRRCRWSQRVLGQGTGTPYQTFTVANTPVIVGLPNTCFTLEVHQPNGGWEAWRQIDDLAAAGPNDKVYLLDPAAGKVTGGSGLTGARFPKGEPVRASYEYGGGPQGNVAIGAVSKSPVLPGGFSVHEPRRHLGCGRRRDRRRRRGEHHPVAAAP